MSDKQPSDQPPPPELIPEPAPVSHKPVEDSYTPASQDIQTREQLEQVTNFIGEIYGKAKQLDDTAIGSSEFVKGLKFDPTFTLQCFSLTIIYFATFRGRLRS